jgi:hypothetical protein
MGTNYYVKTGKKEKVVCNYGCEHLIDEELHIGKYSNGWKFCLHIIPEKNINNLEDWKKILKSGEIYNEYHAEISYKEMIETIVGDYKNKGLVPIPSKYDATCLNMYRTMVDLNDNLLFTNKDKLGKDGSYVLVEGEFS